MDIKRSCSFCALEQWVRVTEEPRHIASQLHFHSAAHALSQSLNKASESVREGRIAASRLDRVQVAIVAAKPK